MQRLLLDDRIIAVQPTLIRALGGKATQAIMLQQLHYWMPHARNEHDGVTWVYKTLDEWADETGLTRKQVRRAMGALVDLGVVSSCQPAGRDRTMWYRIDYSHPMLSDDAPVAAQTGTSTVPEQSRPSAQTVTVEVPERAHVPYSTESTTEITQRNVAPNGADDEKPRHLKPPEDVWPEQTLTVTRKLAKLILEAGHTLPGPLTKQADGWYQEVDRLLRIGPPGDSGGAPPPSADEVLEVARWALTVSDFWPANIRSAGKFRKQWTTLKAQAKRGTGGKPGASDDDYLDAFTRLAERAGQ